MYKIYAFVMTVIILALLGLFTYLLLFSGSKDDQLDSYANREQPEISNPARWLAYENPQFDFTFLYPPEATTSIEAGRAKITYLGPQSIPNSEITDGFTFYVRTQNLPPDVTIENFAEDYFAAETENFGAIAPLSEITIRDARAYRFQAQSALGPAITHTVLEADEDTVFLIASMTADPQNAGYENVIDQIAGTLQLKEAADQSS